MFFGPPTEEFVNVAAGRPPADLRWGERLPAIILLAMLLFIGFWPHPLSDPLDRALQTLYPAAAPAASQVAAK